VVSENALLAAIRPAAAPARPSRWTVFAARPLPERAAEHAFGSRQASISPVVLREDAEQGACWIESMEDGWLFLIPNPPRSGWLLAIGAAPDILAAKSRVVARAVAQRGSCSAELPAYARMTEPVSSPGWLACGAAAMSFDPICGDGTAHAIREAILAAAVIRAVVHGGDERALLAHYQARLTAGFRRHLLLCRDFYESGGTSQFWRGERGAIEGGIQWCDGKLAGHAHFRYRLRGFELEAVT